MANQVEIIVKATDEASKVLQDVQSNAEKSLGGVEAAGEKSAQGLALMAGAAALAVTAVVGLGAAFAKSMSDLLSYAESLDKANQSTGVSVEFWQKLIKAGNEMDITFDSMRGSIERLEKNLEGSGAALRKFGIDVANYQGLTPDQAVRRFADQLEAIQDPMEKTAVVMAATGKAGAENIKMWHDIATGAVDAQKALGADMVAKLNDTDQALDKAKTSVKNLIEQLTATVVMAVPFEGFFSIMTMGFRGLGDMLAAWPGIWKAMEDGAIKTAWSMFQAAVAAGEHEKQTQKTSTAVLGLTETTRKLTKGLDELVAMWIKEGKEEDENTKGKEANSKKLAALWTARMTQLSKEAEESRKTAEAEIKAMNAEAKAEADLTAKLLAEEAKRLDAVQKTREKEAEAAERYFERIIENGLRANETEIQGAQRVLEEVMRRRAELLANSEATAKQITESERAEAEARKQVDEAAHEARMNHLMMILDASSSVLRSLFGKNKAAMIAAVIIETLAAVITSFKNGGGWPWGLIPAAAMAATGAAAVQKIRSQDAGFAAGTPGTSFVDFGAGTPSMLHGQEAVVTRPQAEGVASMVRDAIKEGLRGGRSAASPARIDLHVHLDGKDIAASVGRRFQAGLVPALAR